MKPVFYILLSITLLSAASCYKDPFLPGSPHDPTFVITSWAVNLLYINPDTKEPIIGKGRYFSPSHVHILQKEYTTYRDIFYYNHYNEPDSQKDDSYIISLNHTIYTDVTNVNSYTNVSTSVAIAERFDNEYIVRLKHAQADITDTFRLVKDTEHEFKVYLNGDLILTHLRLLRIKM